MLFPTDFCSYNNFVQGMSSTAVKEKMAKDFKEYATFPCLYFAPVMNNYFSFLYEFVSKLGMYQLHYLYSCACSFAYISSVLVMLFII